MEKTTPGPKALDPWRQALAADPELVGLANRLARHYAKKVPRRMEDFVSAAGLGLVAAAATFDPAHGKSFWNHAYRRIVGAILDERRMAGIRGYRRVSRGAADAPPVVSLSTKLYVDGLGVVPLADTLVSDEEPVGWELEYHDELRGLSQRVRDGVLLRLLYGDASMSTLRICGEQLGVTEGRACQIHSEALARLAERFRHPDEIFMIGRLSVDSVA